MKKEEIKITQEILSAVMSENGKKSVLARKKKYGKDWAKKMIEGRWKGHIKKPQLPKRKYNKKINYKENENK